MAQRAAKPAATDRRAAERGGVELDRHHHGGGVVRRIRIVAGGGGRRLGGQGVGGIFRQQRPKDLGNRAIGELGICAQHGAVRRHVAASPAGSARRAVELGGGRQHQGELQVARRQRADVAHRRGERYRLTGHGGVGRGEQLDLHVGGLRHLSRRAGGVVARVHVLQIGRRRDRRLVRHRPGGFRIEGHINRKRHAGQGGQHQDLVDVAQARLRRVGAVYGVEGPIAAGAAPSDAGHSGAEGGVEPHPRCIIGSAVGDDDGVGYGAAGGGLRLIGSDRDAEISGRTQRRRGGGGQRLLAAGTAGGGAVAREQVHRGRRAGPTAAAAQRAHDRGARRRRDGDEAAAAAAAGSVGIADPGKNAGEKKADKDN